MPARHAPADLLDELCEVFRRLGRDSLYVSLEDEKVLRLDEDPVALEDLVVLRRRGGLAVDPVLAVPGEGDAPPELPLLLLGVDVHREDPRVPRVFHTMAVFVQGVAHLLVDTLAFVAIPLVACPGAVDEVPELIRAQLCATDAEDERDGVHDVALSRAIGPYRACEALEGSSVLETA